VDLIYFDRLISGVVAPVYHTIYEFPVLCEATSFDARASLSGTWKRYDAFETLLRIECQRFSDLPQIIAWLDVISDARMSILGRYLDIMDGRLDGKLPAQITTELIDASEAIFGAAENLAKCLQFQPSIDIVIRPKPRDLQIRLYARNTMPGFIEKMAKQAKTRD
jgi:hypothetical protein